MDQIDERRINGLGFRQWEENVINDTLSPGPGKIATCFILIVTLLLSAASPASAKVERVELIVQAPFADGHIFGDVGAYERIKGKLHYAIDPDDPANQAIVDLDLAQVDDRGLVTFSGDFILLRPIDAERGNRTLLYEVNNRGGLGMLPMFNHGARSNNPSALVHAGDGLLFEQGYSLLWTAWNWDVIAGGDRLLIDLPVAEDEGEPITGQIAAEFVVPQSASSAPFMWGFSKGYPPLKPDDPEAQLTWRDEPGDERQVVPRSSWQFSDFDTSRTPSQPTRITADEPFVPAGFMKSSMKRQNLALSALALPLFGMRSAISVSRIRNPRRPSIGP